MLASPHEQYGHLGLVDFIKALQQLSPIQRGSLPAARMVVFQNSSHTPLYAEPERYIRVLTEFLQAV